MKFAVKYMGLEKHYFAWGSHNPQRTNAIYSHIRTIALTQ